MDRRIYPALAAGLAVCLMLLGSPARAEMIDCIDETTNGTVHSGTVDAAKVLSNIKGILEGMLAKINSATNTGGSSTGGESSTSPESILHDLFGDHFSPEDLANCACPCPLCLALLSALTCDLPTPSEPIEDGVLPGEEMSTTTDPSGNGNTAAAEQTPEPSSLALVGLGSAGLLWWRRRQKGKSSKAA